MPTRVRGSRSTACGLLACSLLVLLWPQPTLSDAQLREAAQRLTQQHASHSGRRRNLLGQTDTDAAAIEAAEAAAAARREAAEQRAKAQELAKLPAAMPAPTERVADGSKAARRGAVSVNQAYGMLNDTVGAVPTLLDPLPSEGQAAMERHRTCGAFWQLAVVGAVSSATNNAGLICDPRLPTLPTAEARAACITGGATGMSWVLHVADPDNKGVNSVDAQWPVRRVALVGNGPLTEQQRMAIGDADLVIRINKMNNRFCGERVDVWLLRHAAEDAHLRWHGLGELAHCGTKEVLQMNPVLWLFGGSSWWFSPYTMAHAAAEFPVIPGNMTWQGIPFAPWKNLYQTYIAPVGSPSTGWIALMLALDCKPADAVVNLYGFNWSPRHWKSHSIAAEERFIRLMADLGRITIHETACKGLRYCGKCNVVDAQLLKDDAAVAINVAIEANLTMPDVPCSPAQLLSAGELTRDQLLDREPERASAD